VSLFVKGSEVPPPVDESIRLFSMCSAFSFKHLPMAGGLFDQNPQLLDRFLYILHAQEEQRKKEDSRKRQMQGGPSPKIRGARPAY